MTDATDVIDGFVPSYLLRQIQQCDDEHATACANNTLVLDQIVREARANPTALPVQGGPAWQIHDARNGTELPGALVRSAGEPAGDDIAVTEAADGIAATLELLQTTFGRDSFDGHGATVTGTVHYGENYDNAFWNGTQLVFGDGDAKIFERFTTSIDVLAHELAHAVTEKTAGLTYSGQSGALNESISDVIGSCVKQRSRGQSATEADWLIGEGIFLPSVKGVALRSMKEPGTAYDDPRLGKDPQVGDMKDYVDTTEDNGGVHLNSGIPNRAFYLAATAIGGDSADGAGRIWYAALTSGIGPDTDFARFAEATVAAAGDQVEAVTRAWQTVGVLPASGGRPAPEGSGSHAPVELQVRRSGGVAGIERRGSLDLDADDDRARQAQQLLGRISLDKVTGGAPSPDRFTYHFNAPGQPEFQVGEQDLTGDLRALAAIVLDDGL